MARNKHVGRSSELTRIGAFLRGATSGVSICAVSGPGGVGKSYLLNEALEREVETTARALLLRADGSSEEARRDFLGVIQQVAPRSLLVARRGGDPFPELRRVDHARRAVLASAARELERAPGVGQREKDLLLALLKGGRTLNRRNPDPAIRVLIDVLLPSDADATELLEAAYGVAEGLGSLRHSSRVPTVLQDLMGWSLEARVREDLHAAVAEALVADLNALLAGPIRTGPLKRLQRRIEHLDRLVLVIDDFEALAPMLQDFLVGALIPALKGAHFPTALVILSRDDLDAMSPSWNQHHRELIVDEVRLRPFSPEEVTELLTQASVAPDRVPGLLQATQGYPFLLSLVLEEFLEEEGNSALFLRKFYDRTTRWMDARQREWFERVCYLDVVNHDTLALLFPAAEVDRVQSWFEEERSIRDPRSAEFTVRPLIREKCLRLFRIRNPTRDRELRERVGVGRGEG